MNTRQCVIIISMYKHTLLRAPDTNTSLTKRIHGVNQSPVYYCFSCLWSFGKIGPNQGMEHCVRSWKPHLFTIWQMLSVIVQHLYFKLLTDHFFKLYPVSSHCRLSHHALIGDWWMIAKLWSPFQDIVPGLLSNVESLVTNVGQSFKRSGTIERHNPKLCNIKKLRLIQWLSRWL